MFWPSTTAALQIALNLQAASAAQTVVDLGSQSWTLTSPDNEDISVPGQVPSQAHIDLYDADIIDDPYVPSPISCVERGKGKRRMTTWKRADSLDSTA